MFELSEIGVEKCEERNPVLNWEKCHFMIKEGIILGHISQRRDISKSSKEWIYREVVNTHIY